MGKTKIEWAGHSWNPLLVREGGRFGCTKVSPGCLNCYASGLNKRLWSGREYDYNFGNWQFTLNEKILNQPLHRKESTIYFVCSMCDLFHENVPLKLVEKMYRGMSDCPQHLFLLLTRRPRMYDQKVYDFCEEYPCRELGGGDYLPNLWLGTSAENQEMWDKRVPQLLSCVAARYFVSVEPMLGPIDMCLDLVTKDRPHVEWVICGGESGANARPMNPEWAQSLRDQCVKYDVSFFFKQWGGKNKRAAGRLLDGIEWNQRPVWEPR